MTESDTITVSQCGTPCPALWMGGESGLACCVLSQIRQRRGRQITTNDSFVIGLAVFPSPFRHLALVNVNRCIRQTRERTHLCIRPLGDNTMFVLVETLLQVERSDRTPSPKYPLFHCGHVARRASRQLLSPWVYARCHTATACCRETSVRRSFRLHRSKSQPSR